MDNEVTLKEIFNNKKRKEFYHLGQGKLERAVKLFFLKFVGTLT